VGRPSVNFYLWQPKLKSDIVSVSLLILSKIGEGRSIYISSSSGPDGSCIVVDLACCELFQYHDSII